MLLIVDYLKARYLSERAQGIIEYALILGFVAVIAWGFIARQESWAYEKTMAIFGNVGRMLGHSAKMAWGSFDSF